MLRRNHPAYARNPHGGRSGEVSRPKPSRDVGTGRVGALDRELSRNLAELTAIEPGAMGDTCVELDARARHLKAVQQSVALRAMNGQGRIDGGARMLRRYLGHRAKLWLQRVGHLLRQLRI